MENRGEKRKINEEINKKNIEKEKKIKYELKIIQEEDKIFKTYVKLPNTNIYLK